MIKWFGISGVSTDGVRPMQNADYVRLKASASASSVLCVVHQGEPFGVAVLSQPKNLPSDTIVKNEFAEKFYAFNTRGGSKAGCPWQRHRVAGARLSPNKTGEKQGN